MYTKQNYLAKIKWLIILRQVKGKNNLEIKEEEARKGETFKVSPFFATYQVFFFLKKTKGTSVSVHGVCLGKYGAIYLL